MRGILHSIDAAVKHLDVYMVFVLTLTTGTKPADFSFFLTSLNKNIDITTT